MKASKPAARPSRRRGDRAREIMDAAFAVFTERGYERASISEIATRVGVTEATIYKHFEGKRDLLMKVLADFYEPNIAQIRREIGAIEGLRNQLRFLVYCQLRALTEKPGLCRLIIGELRTMPDYYESEVHALNRRYTAIALEVIKTAQEAGALRADLSAAMLRDILYGSVEHVAWQATMGRGAVDIDSLAGRVTDVFLGGAVAQAPEPDDAGLRVRLAAVEAGLARLTAVTDRVARAVTDGDDEE